MSWTPLLVLFAVLNVGMCSQFESKPCKPIMIYCACENHSLSISIPMQSEKYQLYDFMEFKKPDDCTPVVNYKQACNNLCAIGIEELKSAGARITHRKNLMSHFYPIPFNRILEEFTPYMSVDYDWTESPYRVARDVPEYEEDSMLSTPTPPCDTHELNNAYVTCEAWPNYFVCEIQCVHEHAMEDKLGVVTNWNVTCKTSENKWKPRDYQDCQPYVQCAGAHLIRPGKVQCQDTVEGPLSCEIECYDYEDFEATSNQKYRCVDVDTYERELPHCVENRKYNGSLVRKPEGVTTEVFLINEIPFR